MSKQLVNQLLKEIYDKGKKSAAKQARNLANKSGYHFVEFTIQDIENIVISNYLYVMEKDVLKQIQQSESGTLGDAAAAIQQREDTQITGLAKDPATIGQLKADGKVIAAEIFDLFEGFYNQGIQEEHLKAETFQDGTIQILQNREYADKIRDAFISSMEKVENKGLFSKLLNNKQKTASFKRAIQFWHIEKTVGTTMVAAMANLKPRKGAAGRNKAIEIVQDILNRIDVEWELTDGIETREISLVGTMGPRVGNFPGSESTDWEVLRREIEERIQEEAQKDNILKKFASGEGSQPFDERLAKFIANDQLLKPARKKGLRATPYKVDRPKNSKADLAKKQKPKNIKPAKLKQGSFVKPPPTRVRKKRGSAEGKGVSSVPFTQMLGVFNSQLQRVVAKNMVPPRLQYRTGRLADSVRVTDITKTSKGFPSIGYTYEKRPYQVFELGYKQGSPEYDPRKLIDFSVREIATQFAMGRFYTRRQ